MDKQEELFDVLSSLVFTGLKLDCPVMSGNMKSKIKVEETGKDFTRIAIEGPSYDIPYWEKTGVIELTGEYDYAVSVNSVGAFNGRSKKSQHWANKSIVKVCRTLAPLYNAEVIVNVEL